MTTRKSQSAQESSAQKSASAENPQPAALDGSTRPQPNGSISGGDAAKTPADIASNGANGAASPLGLDGIDLDSLRLSQDYIEAAGVTKLRTTVPVRKPTKVEFLQVHPEHHFDLFMVEMKDEGEVYFIPPQFLTDVSDIAVPVSLRLAVNRQGVVYLWPVRLPANDRRDNPWHISARDAVDRAASGHWVSVRANKSLGAYEIYEGASNLSPPQWPQESFEEILQIGLRGRVVDSHDHPVLRSLRGEM